MSRIKDGHRLKLIEYCGNPQNPFPNRDVMSVDVLGFKHKSTIYKRFTPAELTEIEKEALEIRRTKYAADLARVDSGQLKKAAEGDAAAAKLVYQRFEKWVPVTGSEQSGPGGGAIPVSITLAPEVAAIIDRIRADVLAHQEPKETPDGDEQG